MSLQASIKRCWSGASAEIDWASTDVMYSESGTGAGPAYLHSAKEARAWVRPVSVRA